MEKIIWIVQTSLSGDLNDAEIGSWAQAFVDSKLAACIHVTRSRSIYRWDDKIQSTSEWQIQFFTSEESKEELLIRIKSHHPYNLPSIVSWPTESTKEYFEWVNR